MKKLLLNLILVFCLSQLFLEISNSQTPEEYFDSGKKKLFLDPKGAIVEFDMAIKLKPNNSEAYYYRGFSKFLNIQVKESITDYTKAIEINPSYTRAYES